MAKSVSINDERLISTLTLVKEAFERNILTVLESRSVYGNSWMDCRMVYFTDRIANKAQRIRNIEDQMLFKDNKETDGCRSGIEEELKDIVSYALFALVKMNWLKMDSKWVFRYFGVIPEED